MVISVKERKSRFYSCVIFLMKFKTIPLGEQSRHFVNRQFQSFSYKIQTVTIWKQASYHGNPHLKVYSENPIQISKVL